jgi:hypothetical protein
MLAATVLLAILTAVYVVLTARYVCLTRKLVRAQSDACVIAYTQETDEGGVSFIQIVIENIGRGTARDVRIERSENVEDDKWREFLDGPTICPALRTTLLRGVPILRPGGKVVIRWKRADQTHLSLGDGLPVVCRCKRLRRSDEPGETELEPLDCYLQMYPCLGSA